MFKINQKKFFEDDRFNPETGERIYRGCQPYMELLDKYGEPPNYVYKKCPRSQQSRSTTSGIRPPPSILISSTITKEKPESPKNTPSIKPKRITSMQLSPDTYIEMLLNINTSGEFINRYNSSPSHAHVLDDKNILNILVKHHGLSKYKIKTFNDFIKAFRIEVEGEPPIFAASAPFKKILKSKWKNVHKNNWLSLFSIFKSYADLYKLLDEYNFIVLEITMDLQTPSQSFFELVKKCYDDMLSNKHIHKKHLQALHEEYLRFKKRYE